LPERHRVVASELSVGQPLPWNVFDADNVLLLRRGYVIESQHAIDRMIEEGIFLNEQDTEEYDFAAQDAAKKKPSTLQYLTDARRLFGSAMAAAGTQDFPARIQRIAQLVDLACQASADVAIASVLLLQDHGYMVRHHVDTAVIADLMGRAMSLPPDKILVMAAAALTMDLSMYEIQDKLNEVKGPLNDKLRGLIVSHPEQSAQRLRKLGVADEFWLRCVEHHHECENGAGHPKGLKGPDIEPCAKIIGLADRYCAEVSVRGYRATRPPSAALKDIYTEKGAEIDATVAAYLLRVVGLYPPGTIVRLHNGETAIVTEAADNADTPIACSVLGANGAALAVPVKRKTIREDFRIVDVLTVDKVDFPIQMSRLWGDEAKLG
jgi:HD-GYP domain-containing protein (c-di-GMP phosphodiesterase class II)